MSLLVLGGLLGMVLFLSFETVVVGQDHWVFQMGTPDTWFFWEDRPDGHRTEMNFLRWSMGIGLASIFALVYAVSLGLRRSVPDPGAPAK